jgi:acyl-CoA thioesterase-1
MRVFCMGDSLTAGYGVPPGKSWRDLAAAETGCEMINGGLNGDTSWGMLYRLNRDVLPDPPDLLFLLGGSNDILNDGATSMLKHNIGELINRCRDAGIPVMIGIPCPVLGDLAQLFWSPDIDYSAADVLLEDYASWLRGKAAELGTPPVDFWNLFSAMDRSELSALYLDGLHLKEEGHRMMAGLFVKQFSQCRAELGI